MPSQRHLYFHSVQSQHMPHRKRPSPAGTPPPITKGLPNALVRQRVLEKTALGPEPQAAGADDEGGDPPPGRPSRGAGLGSSARVLRDTKQLRLESRANDAETSAPRASWNRWEPGRAQNSVNDLFYFGGNGTRAARPPRACAALPHEGSCRPLPSRRGSDGSGHQNHRPSRLSALT